MQPAAMPQGLEPVLTAHKPVAMLARHGNGKLGLSGHMGVSVDNTWSVNLGIPVFGSQDLRLEQSLKGTYNIHQLELALAGLWR